MTKIKRVKQKSDKQKSKLENTQKLTTAQKNIYGGLFYYYSWMVPEAKNKAKHEKRLKILTSKQMFQRIPIAIAQVKANNTSENLLNEICQII